MVVGMLVWQAVGYTAGAQPVSSYTATVAIQIMRIDLCTERIMKQLSGPSHRKRIEGNYSNGPSVSESRFNPERYLS